jgi:tight adherence protein C
MVVDAPPRQGRAVTLSGALAALATGLCMLVVARHLVQRIPVRQPGPRAAAAVGRGSRLARRRRQRHHARLLDAAFPELLDLVVVSVQAGLLPADALRDAATLVEPPLRHALDAVEASLSRGERFADALQALVEELGPRALGLVATVVATDRHGLPLAPALDRLADEARDHRRRLAEATARELPVRMSFPLVLCTLPSFALVAIVPLLVGALSSLQPG